MGARLSAFMASSMKSSFVLMFLSCSFVEGARVSGRTSVRKRSSLLLSRTLFLSFHRSAVKHMRLGCLF